MGDVDRYIELLAAVFRGVTQDLRYGNIQDKKRAKNYLWSNDFIYWCSFFNNLKIDSFRYKLLDLSLRIRLRDERKRK